MRLRKENLFLCVRALAVLCVTTSVSLPRAFAAELILQDQTLLAAFDTHSGALTRLEDKTTHWIVERRPQLAISFRLHAPLPNRRDNTVFGEKQTVAEVKKPSDDTVVMKWKNLVSEHGGVLPMT